MSTVKVHIHTVWSLYFFVIGCQREFLVYSKTCLKRPHKEIKIGFLDRLSLNTGQKYCRMLQGEHSTILSTFIKLPFVLKIFVLSIFEWPLKLFYKVSFNSPTPTPSPPTLFSPHSWQLLSAFSYLVYFGIVKPPVTHSQFWLRFTTNRPDVTYTVKSGCIGLYFEYLRKTNVFLEVPMVSLQIHYDSWRCYYGSTTT